MVNILVLGSVDWNRWNCSLLLLQVLHRQSSLLHCLFLVSSGNHKLMETYHAVLIFFYSFLFICGMLNCAPIFLAYAQVPSCLVLYSLLPANLALQAGVHQKKWWQVYKYHQQVGLDLLTAYN